MPKCILSGQVKSTFTQEQADGRYIQMTNGATTTLASSLQVSGINNIEFTEEGEESIPASNVSYSNTTSGMTSENVQNAIDELFQSVSEGKSLIAAAVTDKGVETAATDSFTTMAGNIGQISVGIQLPDLSNPGAAGGLRSGKQLVGADGSIVTGNLPEVIQATPTISVSSGGLITASATQSGGIVEGGSKSATQQLTTQAAKTVTPGTTNQTAVASGRYTTGAVTVKGDANLKAENIAEGVSIFGVTGTHSGEFVTGTFKSGSYSLVILYPTQKESEGYSYGIVGMGSSIRIDEQIPKYSLVYARPGEKLTISGGITRVNTYNSVGQDKDFFFVSGDFTIEG